MGGRAYLAAYAQRFGASGLTFYDDDVVRFFSPHAAGLDAIFVTALGRAAREAGAGAAHPPPRALSTWGRGRRGPRASVGRSERRRSAQELAS